MADKTPDFSEDTPATPPASGSLFNTIIGKTLSTVSSAVTTARTTVSEAVTKASTIATEAVNKQADADFLKAVNASVLPTPKGTDPDTPFVALNSLEGWSDNVLQGIRQPTYHIRWFMTEDSPIEYTKLQTYDQVIAMIRAKKSTTIVESGITGLSIEGMTITTIAGPNAANRSMDATKINMTVKEPLGVNFLDLLVQTANELKVRNYTKTWFYIELKFQGYEEDGTFALNPCSDFPNKGTWLYQVQLLNIDTDFTESGSTYNLEFRPYSEGIFGSKETSDLTLPCAIMPEGSTVGEMLGSLSKSLNEAYEVMYQDANYKRFEFRIEPFTMDDKTYHPETFKIISSSETQINSIRNWSMDTSGNTIKGNFSHGLKINDIVENVIANSEAGQQLGKAVMTQTSLNSDKNVITDCVVFKVVPGVEITDYDFVTQNYKLKYILTVKAYRTQLPILSQFQVQVANDPKAQAANVMKLRKAGYLVKRYDYLFTGLNTEVTKLDIKYNTIWSANLPRIAGFGGSIESNSDHEMYRDRESITASQKEITDLHLKIMEIQSSKSKIETYNNSILQTTNADDKKALTQQRDQEQTRLNKLTEFEDLDRLQQKESGLQQRLGQSVNDFNKQEQTRLGTIPTERPPLKYAEELNDSDTLLTDMKPQPITIVQDNADTRFHNGGSFPDYYHRDRSIYGAIMDQMYASTGGAMQNLNMEIIGDPYWLGRDNIEREFTSLTAASLETPVIRDFRENKDPFRPNYDDGDILFLLKFKYPQGFDEATNNPKFKDNETFTGVYKIVSVTQSFEGGLFRQSIEAIRMPLTQVFTAFGWRSEDAIATAAEQSKKII